MPYWSLMKHSRDYKGAGSLQGELAPLVFLVVERERVGDVSLRMEKPLTESQRVMLALLRMGPVWWADLRKGQRRTLLSLVTRKLARRGVGPKGYENESYVLVETS